MKNSGFRLTQAPPSAPQLGHVGWRAITLCWVLFCALTPAPAALAEANDEDRLSDGIERVDGIQRSLEGPDVVITAGKDRTVYEYRQNGQLRIVKIVPTFGRPYYLVPADQTRGFGDLGQADMLVPQWVIVEF